MVNLVDVSQWDAGVYQFATTDPIQGGAGGIDNEPHQNLTNRALWLRNRIAAVISQSGQTEGTTDNTQLAAAVTIHCATIVALRALPVPVVASGNTVVVATRGQVTETDGLSCFFKWVATSTFPDDGVSVILPSSAPANGRWIRCGINANALGGQPASYFAGAVVTAQALALLAPINNATLTGTAQAPTPARFDRSSKISTTQFTNDNFVPNSGICLIWNSNPGTWYKIATLPASSIGTVDSINIRATLNTNYAAGNDTVFDGILGNRGNFSFAYNMYGLAATSQLTRIIGQREADGSVSIYVYSSATFAYAYITITNVGPTSAQYGTSGAVIYPVPAGTTVPTGTGIFDSGNPSAYPPLLAVTSSTTYLTAATAATTYLPLAGGVVTGNVTIAGGDMYVYRAGGATGVVHLNAAGSAYVYYDGANYSMPSGEVIANGYQLARLSSPNFQGNPTAPTVATSDSSASIANTAFVKNVLASYAPLANAPLTGTPTAPTAAPGTSNAQLANTAFVQAADLAAAPILTSNYYVHPPSTGGIRLIECWGVVSGPGNIAVTFVTNAGNGFPTALLDVSVSAHTQGSSPEVTVFGESRTGCQIAIANGSGGARWHAWGY